MITFIYYGDWDSTLNDAPSAQNLDKARCRRTRIRAITGDVAQVKSVMQAKGCLNCHQLGNVGGRIAADLTDVGSRRTADWLQALDPEPGGDAGRASAGRTCGWSRRRRGCIRRSASGSPTATPNPYPMNTTFMPQIKMTDQELNLLVDYLSHARTTTK